MKRLIFLDFLRGFFIIYVLFAHAIGNVVFGGQPSAINSQDSTLVMLVSPFLLIGTWAPIFAFISGTANVYVLYNLMAKNPTNEELKKAVLGIMINSFFVLLLSYMNMGLFHHSFDFNGQMQYTLLSGLTERGIIKFYPDLLFYTDAMHIIAVSGFVLSILLFFLWRNGRFEKKRRNIVILAGLAFLIFLASPILVKNLEPIYYSELNSGNYFTTLLLKGIVGPRQSTFPNVANALIGGIFGIAIAQNANKRDIQEFGIAFGLLFLAIDCFLILPDNPIIASDYTRHDLPSSIYFLNISLQILLFTYLICKMEYSIQETRLKISKKTTGVRRFGLLALTIYIFEGIMADLLSKIYIPLWGSNFVFQKNPLAIGIFILLDIGMWYVILRIWERFDFKYSIEWWLVNIVGRLRGRKSSRLQVQETLYNPVNMSSELLETTFEPLFPAEALQKTNLELILGSLTKSLESIQELGHNVKEKILRIFRDQIEKKPKENKG